MLLLSSSVVFQRQVRMRTEAAWPRHRESQDFGDDQDEDIGMPCALEMDGFPEKITRLDGLAPWAAHNKLLRPFRIVKYCR